MSIILQPKIKYQPYQRQPILSNRPLHINIFLNQRISSCISTHPSSPCTNVRMLTLPQRYSLTASSTRSQSGRRSSSSFRQILKHTACRSAMARRPPPIFKKQQIKEDTSPSRKSARMIHIERRSLVNVIDDFSAIRKKIEQRFQRTKMILKEEAKMKKFQKIQQIYEQKFKSLVRQPGSKSPRSPQH